MPPLLLIDDLPIRVSADGRWLHGDEGLHPKVAVLFSKCLIPKENGEYELQVGQQRAPVLVSDVGFCVRLGSGSGFGSVSDCGVVFSYSCAPCLIVIQLLLGVSPTV